MQIETVPFKGLSSCSWLIFLHSFASNLVVVRALRVPLGVRRRTGVVGWLVFLQFGGGLIGAFRVISLWRRRPRTEFVTWSCEIGLREWENESSGRYFFSLEVV